MPTASVVIIGDEILSGKFPDENGPYLIRRLRDLGVQLQRIAVVPDQLPVIAEEVRRASERSDFVITTGGVGPTHDDITFEGVGLAFDLPLEVEPRLEALIDRHGLHKDAGTLRMATVPKGATLVSAGGLSYPIVQVRNVFVLPGVPKLVRRKFEALAPRWAGEAVRCVRLHARDAEAEVAVEMGEVAAAFPTVAIGSYPRFDEDNPLIVTLEGRDPVAIEQAVAALRRVLDVVLEEERP
jgi:molybdenum cofactor synthesis domain-containing protein